MPVPPPPTAAPETLAPLVATAVLRHPDVVALHPGGYGAVATWLPGRRLVGVRIGGPADPVELGVVLRLRRPIPAVVAELRTIVRSVCGAATGAAQAVDVTVGDVTP